MKKFLLASLLVIPAFLSAASFEGKVDFKITTGRGKAEQMSYQMKEGKIRMEVAGQKEVGGIIVDVAQKQTLMLMDKERMYMVMAMPDVAAQAASQSEEGTLERTGEKEKILGYEAVKYVSTYQGKKTDLWLAEGLGTFMAMPSGNPMGGQRGSSGQAWERALAGKELFPLRVVSYEKGNRESFRMEATAVEKKSLPDSLFSPPAGYQKFDMGGMMQGMMPGFPGSRK
jgi:hypothetical protein